MENTRIKTQDRRRDTIRQLLAEQGTLRVEELVEQLNVTSMTVRRDLSAMEDEGLLLRNHGGCSLQSPMVRNLNFSEKDAKFATQKAAIAREAVKHIPANSRIYIDTGTTALHFARSLPTNLNLEIFTNNLRVAMDLFSREGFIVNVYGGQLDKTNPDLTGETALLRVQEYNLDLAILGADAVDASSGEVFAADIPTANIDRVVGQKAMRKIILADSSKFNQRSFAAVAQLGAGALLITDSGVSQEDLVLLKRTGAEVIVASCED